jgi:hypothetical protein
MFMDQITILMLSLLNFLSKSVTALAYKPNWLYFQVCLTKFNELVLLSRFYVSNFQKACVVHLLYSQILKKSAMDLSFLSKSTKSSTKYVLLKSLSI